MAPSNSCPQCGYPAAPQPEGTASFCEACGAAVPDAGFSSYLDEAEAPKTAPVPSAPARPKRNLPVAALLLVVLAVLFAVAVGVWAVLPLILGDSSDPQTWVDHHDARGGFSARFPRKPNPRQEPVQTAVGERVLHLARCSQGKASYEISWFDLRGEDGSVAAYNPERGLELVAEKGRVVQSHWTQVSGNSALRGEVHVGENERTEVAIVMRGSRVYILAISGTRRDQPSQFDDFLRGLAFK